MSNRREQKPKPVMPGRNLEFAQASMRHVPKSKNKARFDKKASRQMKQRGFQ